jgi:uncharacterized SAM-binding protein YcdF (DUF218 family)
MRFIPLDGFLVKKILGRTLDPLYVSIIMMCGGLVIYISYGSWQTGLILVVIGASFLFVVSLPLTGFLLIRPLYRLGGPPADPEALRRLGVRNVVVLGNIFHGVILWKRLGRGKLLISSWYESRKLAGVAMKLGVPESEIVLEPEGRDTEEQALRLKRLLGSEPFAMCTWPHHMPRAMALFRDYGLCPVPAPSRLSRLPRAILCSLQPSRRGLKLSTGAFHEYMGILWLKAKGSPKEWRAAQRLEASDLQIESRQHPEISLDTNGRAEGGSRGVASRE